MGEVPKGQEMSVTKKALFMQVQNSIPPSRIQIQIQMREVPKGQEMSVKKALFMQVQDRIPPTMIQI
jgi:hypothetical protein